MKRKRNGSELLLVLAVATSCIASVLLATRSVAILGAREVGVIPADAGIASVAISLVLVLVSTGFLIALSVRRQPGSSPIVEQRADVLRLALACSLGSLVVLNIAHVAAMTDIEQTFMIATVGLSLVALWHRKADSLDSSQRGRF
jgi:hypothetical protein